MNHKYTMLENDNQDFDKKVLITYALLLGTNMGSKVRNLNFACQELSSRGMEIIRKSSIYQTPAWGMEGDDFLNQALLVSTHLKPLDVLLECIAIEIKLGRVRNAQAVGYQSRILDLDLLHAGSFISQVEVLMLPHPRLELRKFALTPLAEIDPDWRHPILQKNARELLDICNDDSQLMRLDD